MCNDYGLNYKDMDFEPDPELVDDEIYWHPHLLNHVLEFINDNELTHEVDEFIHKRITWLIL